MNSEQPTSEPSSDIPSYTQSLIDHHGADAVARYRADVLPLLRYGDLQTALKVGDAAPPFTLSDASGAPHSLAELLARGPVVAIFYRGGWCPFCNVQLRAFQMARTRLKALQASVILISPERSEHSRSLIEQHALQFPLLRDSGNRVARQYGLAFQIDAGLRERHLEMEIDLAESNGEEPWELPLPATFVVDRAGRICYAFVSTDYTQRAEPADVLTVLQRLASGR